MIIKVPTKYLFCIYSPKKDDYMIASFPTLKLAEYELSRLQTDEFFSDALVNGPIVAEVYNEPGYPCLSLLQEGDPFFTLQEIVSELKEVSSDGDIIKN